MKTLIALLMFASVSYAGDLAYMKNEAGGKIVFTDDACATLKGAYQMYATNDKGQYIFGCWVFPKDSETIMVKFDDGAYRMYPPTALVFTSYGKEVLDSGKKL